VALAKLTIPPDKSGYSFLDGPEVLSVELAGGAPRIRLDVIGAWAKMQVQWTVGTTDYVTLRTFYGTNKGLPFLLDLIFEEAVPTQHRVCFAPGTFGLSEYAGLTYVVRAELFVEPAVTP
jgi:hypothetical protein